MKISVNWLQTYFEEELPPVEELADKITMHVAEIDGIEEKGDDSVLDVKVLPDRAHYMLSHFGVASEVSAILNFDTDYEERIHDKQNIRESLERVNAVYPLQVETEKCDVYRAVHILLGKSINDDFRTFIKEKIESVGQRSISPVVDIMNFVMLDIGQPLHVFDAKKIEKGITVRMAQEGETMVTLDKNQATLTGSEVVIADSSKILALAGIKGGVAAETNDATTSIVLEAAHFDATTTRKTGTVHNIKTDAGKRFENGFPNGWVDEGMYYALELLQRTYPDMQIMGYGSHGDIEKVEKEVKIDVSEINDILGTVFAKNEIHDALVRVGCVISGKKAQIPWYRNDIQTNADIAEEVGRIIGYDKVFPVQLSMLEKVSVNPFHAHLENVRETLLREGFSEVISYNFVKKGAFKVLKPQSPDRASLRKSIVPELIEIAKRNIGQIDIIGADRVQIFEIGSVFSEDDEEKVVLALSSVMSSGKKKSEAKNSIETMLKKLHLEEEKVLEKDGVFFVEVEISSENEKSLYPKFGPVKLKQKFKEFSPYPYIVRDIAAFTPNDAWASDMEEIIKNTAGPLLKKLRQFDSYTNNEGRTSLAYRLVFQAEDRTLTDVEIDPVIERVVDALKKAQFEIR